ncbi:hypothetical protein DK847_04880 [Aestuariivirga litoralis]|uniref:Uncharacterized protein n=1 Tax=Aestuariivirga litoralis TaxID=2650924 RepID=A0A2W2BC71_9HYPH|nr:hypothetical protein [Aestuariivirga litoralis]PZF77768.1 hypothetical protein DK847_04880 [Aestuariivirga litoralis]
MTGPNPQAEYLELRRLPESVLIALLSVAAVLVVVHSVVNYCWVTQACGPLTALDNAYGYLFNLSNETNVPTWFSIIILFLVSLCTLPMILDCRRKGIPALGWWGLFFIFLLLSLDEESDLHGMLKGLVKDPGSFGLHNALFAWVIPGAVIVLVVGLVYLRWVWRLPARTRWLIIAAGVLYVGGALVMELLGGMIADDTYMKPGYLVVSTLEESLEMTGVVVMIYALLDYARQLGIAFRF